MSVKKREIPFWAKLGHKKPTTRREFLATGIIPFSAWAVPPSLTTLLLPKAASAADCSSAGPSFIPFITLNLAGGPSLVSQVVAKKVNGENLRSYTKLGQGVGPGISFNVEKEFGNVEFAGTAIGGNTQGLVSKFLTGLRNPRAQNGFVNPAIAKTAFVWSAVASGDDTAMNNFDVTGLVVKMGLTGAQLPNIGRVDSSTGISQKPALLPPPAPFIVGNLNDLTSALGYASGLAGMKTSQKTAIARLIASVSGSQAKRIAETPGAQLIAEAVECIGVKNVDLVRTGGGDVNPYTVGGSVSTEMARIWGVNLGNINATTQNTVFGAMVYNGIVGNAATVNLNMGGYDYHDNTRTTGDTRDLAAGGIVGRILETAALVNKPVFIYVCADGATVSQEAGTADGPWMSDRGISGMQYIIAYHPAGRPATSSSQIGGFNDGQAADGSFPTGNSPDLAAQAIFANYAAWNGRIDFLDQYGVIRDADIRSKILKFSKA